MLPGLEISPGWEVRNPDKPSDALIFTYQYVGISPLRVSLPLTTVTSSEEIWLKFTTINTISSLSLTFFIFSSYEFHDDCSQYDPSPD